MQSQYNQNHKTQNKKKGDVQDRFLKILWRKEVDLKFNNQLFYKKQILIMKIKVGFIILFIFYSLSDGLVKKWVLKNKLKKVKH